MKLAIQLILIFALVVGVGFLFKSSGVFVAFHTPTPVTSGVQPTPINRIMTVAAGDDLSGFPGSIELPLPASATIIKQYQATTPTGTVQVTKMLESSKSLDENISYFRNLFKDPKLGWKLISEIGPTTTPNHAALFASSAGGIMTVNLNYTPTAKKTVIDLSFVINK